MSYTLNQVGGNNFMAHVLPLKKIKQLRQNINETVTNTHS